MSGIEWDLEFGLGGKISPAQTQISPGQAWAAGVTDFEVRLGPPINPSFSVGLDDLEQIPLDGEALPPGSATAVNPLTMTEPHCLEVEQAFLGGALVDAAAVLARVGDFLRPEHFWEPLHQRIYATMLRLKGEGSPVDALVLMAELRLDPVLSSLRVNAVNTWGPDEGRSAVATPINYIARLVAAASPLMCDGYAEVILDFHRRRTIARVSRDLYQAMHEMPQGHSDDLIKEAMDALMKGAKEADVRMRRSYSSLAAYGDERMASLERGDQPRLIYAGTDRLDRRLGGFAPGSLVVIAGRPGMGKSALSSSLGVSMARKGHGILRFDMEMSIGQQFDRMLADRAYSSGANNVSYEDLGLNKLDLMQRDRIKAVYAGFLRDLPIIVDDRPALNILQIGLKIEATQARLRRQNKRIDVVVVDHIGLMKPMHDHRGRRDLEVSEFTNGLKELAKNHDVAVLALCQLNRQVEGREDKRPHLSDLRDSGRIEEDADMVLMVFRPAYYLGRDPDHDKAEMEAKRYLLELQIAKNRGGQTGPLKLFADMATSHVNDWSD